MYSMHDDDDTRRQSWVDYLHYNLSLITDYIENCSK